MILLSLSDKIESEPETFIRFNVCFSWNTIFTAFPKGRSLFLHDFHDETKVSWKRFEEILGATDASKVPGW